MPVTLSPPMRALRDAVDDLAGHDLFGAPEEVVLDDTEQLLVLRNRIDAELVRRVGVLDGKETTIALRGRVTRSWLIEEGNLNPGRASALRRLALELPARPALAAAFAAGDVSLEHAIVIMKALRQVPPEFVDIVEKALVEEARFCPPADLGDKVEQLLVACGVESSADEAAVKRLTKRGLSVASTIDGMRSVSGLLTPEVGAAFERALAAFADTTGPEDDRSVAQRNHDAVGELAGYVLGHAELPAVNGERPRVVVTIDFEALAAQLREAWGRLPNGATIAPATARRLACDAEILPAVLGARGEVLDIGVASRSFPTAVRRAAWLEQHGRCAFPRCRRPPVDCHHVVFWADGGPSSLDNAAWLCAVHHWLVHERHWSMRRQADRSFVFTSPEGREATGPPPRAG